ncbi:MAG: penicillin-binding protein, partial [Chloroflexi bacterium]|nr:penicillin-binding protein [Chloroflexota bacterium]
MANAALYRYKAYRRRRWHARPDGAPRWIMAAALLGLILLIGGGAAAAVSYGVYQGYADELVPPDEEIAKLPRGGARILDRNRTLLFEFVDDSSGLRDPVSYEDISLYLVAATIALEDTTFMTNPGVNYQGLASAAWDRFRNTSIVRNLFRPFGDALPAIETRGGSSITQQLVKNIYFSAEERSERSINQEGIERKLKETVLALELTKQYSKQQIMEWYLNQISYGNVFIGAEAASRGYFNKQAIDLTLAEAALLAAIPSCPACYDPLTLPEEAKAQRNFVLRRMHAEGMIDAGTLWETSTQPLDLDPRQFDVEAPHFVFNVVQPELERLFGEEAARSGGLVVTTTLDLEEHRAAEAILRGWITTFESSGGHNGAVVAIDPKTAEILVYVGSRDYFREDIDGQNDMASALNSPGSAFKPFTYLTAFINLGWGPGTMILDSEFPLQFWDGERPPRNPGGGYQGPITARNALGN